MCVRRSPRNSRAAIGRPARAPTALRYLPLPRTGGGKRRGHNRSANLVQVSTCSEDQRPRRLAPPQSQRGRRFAAKSTGRWFDKRFVIDRLQSKMTGCFSFLNTLVPSWRRFRRLENERGKEVACSHDRDELLERLASLEARVQALQESNERQAEEISNLKNGQQTHDDRFKRTNSRVEILRKHFTRIDLEVGELRDSRCEVTMPHSPAPTGQSEVMMGTGCRPFEVPSYGSTRHNSHHTTTGVLPQPSRQTINFSSLERTTDTCQRTRRPGKFFIFKHNDPASTPDDNLLPNLNVLKKSWERLGYKIEEYDDLEPLEIMDTMHSSTLHSHEDEQHCFLILSPTDQTKYLPIMQLCTIDPTHSAMFYIQNSGGQNTRPNIPTVPSNSRRTTVFELARQEIDEIDSDESNTRSATPEFPTLDLSTINLQLIGRLEPQRNRDV